MKSIKKYLLLALTVLAVSMFISCSDDSGDSEESLVTKYMYNLTSNENYYIVDVFFCIDNGNNVFDVRYSNRHFFKNTSENFKDKTGLELIALVKSNSLTATSTKTRTQQTDTTATARNSNGEITATYNIPAGMSYTVYYYE